MNISELLQNVKRGDVLLTSNPDGLGNVITWFQNLQGDPSIYTHAALFPYDALPKIYEANGTLDIKNITQYIGYKICIIRHKFMTDEAYRKGFREIKDNVGQIYPWHRLLLIGLDNGFNWLFKKLRFKFRSKIARIISRDRPVCSEWVVQFFNSAYIKMGFVNGECWQGKSPDDIDDARIAHPELWETVYEGHLDGK